MITFDHVEGVWEQLAEAEREIHGMDLEGFTAELAAEKGRGLVGSNEVREILSL
jgi:hypothetical protein